MKDYYDISKVGNKRPALCRCLVCGVCDNVDDNLDDFLQKKKNSWASVVSRSLNVHVIFSIPLSGFRGRGWVKM